MAKKETCVVLERLAEMARENSNLRGKIRILTEAVVSGNKGYLEKLRKQEVDKVSQIIQEKKGEIA